MNVKNQFLLILWTIIFPCVILAQGNMFLTHGKKKVKIPFEYHNHLIILPVKVNGIPLNFLMDTGASKTVIFTLNEATDIEFYETQSIMLRGLGDGEPIEAILSSGNTLELKYIRGENQEIYLVFNEQFDLSSRVGKTIHGIIGYEFLKNFGVTIDYNNKYLTVEDKNHFKKPKSKKFEQFFLEFNQNKPYVTSFFKAYISSDKKEVTMLIDSGNTDALWLFEDPEREIERTSPTFPDHLGEGLSGSIDGYRGMLSDFYLGNFHLKKPTISFLDSTQTTYARKFEKRNGSIGNQILSRFKVVLDYSGRQLWLKKTKSFNSEFKYNRAGIELSYFGKTLVRNEFANPSINGYGNQFSGHEISLSIYYRYEFRPLYGIHIVRPNSPAEKAGLQVDDIIERINDRAATEYSIDEIMEKFYGKNGETIKLEIIRKGQLLKYQFELQDYVFDLP
jgi:hypothetical protein